jgi:hypothetical protein
VPDRVRPRQYAARGSVQKKTPAAVIFQAPRTANEAPPRPRCQGD